MECPYKYRKDCKEVDSSGMTKLVRCNNCDWFGNGVRESRGNEILGWLISKFKKK